MSKVSMLVSQFSYVMAFDLFARPQAWFSSVPCCPVRPNASSVWVASLLASVVYPVLAGLTVFAAHGTNAAFDFLANCDA